MAFDQLGRTPPPPLPPSWHSNIEFFFILMDSIHFKPDFSMKKKVFFAFTSFSHLLFTVSKLYKTYYLVRLLMMVCTVLIWFILTVLQESSNLDAIFIVCRKIKNKISKLVFSADPPPPFLVKSQLFDFFFLNPSLTQWYLMSDDDSVVQYIYIFIPTQQEI